MEKNWEFAIYNGFAQIVLVQYCYSYFRLLTMKYVPIMAAKNVIVCGEPTGRATIADKGLSPAKPQPDPNRVAPRTEVGLTRCLRVSTVVPPKD